MDIFLLCMLVCLAIALVAISTRINDRIGQFAIFMAYVLAVGALLGVTLPFPRDTMAAIWMVAFDIVIAVASYGLVLLIVQPAKLRTLNARVARWWWMRRGYTSRLDPVYNHDSSSLPESGR